MRTILKSVIHGDHCSSTVCRLRSLQTTAPSAFLTVKVLSTKQQSLQPLSEDVTHVTSQSHPFVILQGTYLCLQGIVVQFFKNMRLMAPQTIWVMLPIRPLLGEFPLCAAMIQFIVSFLQKFLSIGTSKVTRNAY